MSAVRVYSFAVLEIGRTEGEQYFATLRIPILRGRDFEITDHERKPTPAIVNRTLALVVEMSQAFSIRYSRIANVE